MLPLLLSEPPPPPPPSTPTRCLLDLEEDKNRPSSKQRISPPPRQVGKLSSSSSSSSSSSFSSSSSSSSASSSGVSEMSDGGASSVSSSRRLSSLDEEMSETSDYQRSTPSPRDDLSSNASSVGCINFKQGNDLGLGDEIEIRLEEDESSKLLLPPLSPALAKLVQRAAEKTKARKKKKKKRKNKDEKKLKLPCTVNSDPKILFHQARVSVHKLVVTAKMISRVSDALDSGVHVSPKKSISISSNRKRCAEDNVNSWFAKRSCPSNPTTPEKASCGSILRPAILNVKSPSAKLASSGTFSVPLPVLDKTPNNPFLPISKTTSYLFGGSDDFEQANDEELLIIDEDAESNSDEEEEEEEEEKEEAAAGKKEDYEAEAPSLQEVDMLIARDLEQEVQREKKEEEKIVLEVKEVKEIATNVVEDAAPKIRFPALRRASSNMIECKWSNCQMNFTSYGKLSDHLKAAHVIGQLYEKQQHLESNPGSDELYECRWEGCKVFGKKSCSSSWLEKHVPVHGGKFNFACIVDACKKRFSSQHLLQRHVNSHFSQSDRDAKKGGGGDSSGCKKKPSDAQSFANTLSESSKNLKRAGVKLKFRCEVFSARIFDFFDVGMMAGLKSTVTNLEQVAPGDNVTFRSKVLALRTDEKTGQRRAQIRWVPENILEDEWLPIRDVTESKIVNLTSVPVSSRPRMQEHLFGIPSQAQVPKLTGAKKRKQQKS